MMSSEENKTRRKIGEEKNKILYDVANVGLRANDREELFRFLVLWKASQIPPVF